MRYIMKSGMLSSPENGTILAQIKRDFWGARKTILLPAGDTSYQTDISAADAPEERRGDVRFRIYTLKDNDNKVWMEGRPGYAKEDDPDVVGWSLCRAPKVDHADILLHGAAYVLVMNNSQNYSLQDQTGTAVLQIMHKGIAGGWTIQSSEAFPPQVLCGLFLFCRYLEQENEFIVV